METNNIKDKKNYRKDAELLCVSNDELQPLATDILSCPSRFFYRVIYRPSAEGVHHHQSGHSDHAHPEHINVI